VQVPAEAAAAGRSAEQPAVPLQSEQAEAHTEVSIDFVVLHCHLACWLAGEIVRIMSLDMICIISLQFFARCSTQDKAMC